MGHGHAAMVTVQDRLIAEERSESDDLARNERHYPGYGGLGGRHHPAPWHRDEGRADQPGTEIGAELQHAEDADGQYRVLQAEDAGQERIARPSGPGWAMAKAMRPLSAIGVSVAASSVQ